MITSEQTQRQIDLLPRFWGRFSKSIEQLVSLSRPDETLLAACVTVNPSFEHRSISLLGGLTELTKSTNALIAVTDQRLLVLAIGVGGAPGTHVEIAFAGLEIVGFDKHHLTLRWPDGELRFSGAAKTMLPPLVQALEAQFRPRS